MFEDIPRIELRSSGYKAEVITIILKVHGSNRSLFPHLRVFRGGLGAHIYSLALQLARVNRNDLSRWRDSNSRSLASNARMLTNSTTSRFFVRERVSRIELPSPVWQTGALTIVLYPQIVKLTAPLSLVLYVRWANNFYIADALSTNLFLRCPFQEDQEPWSIFHWNCNSN